MPVFEASQCKKIHLSKKIAAGVGVLTNLMSAFEASHFYTKPKKQKKTGVVGVLAKSRLNLFTARFSTGFRREPVFFRLSD